MNDNILEIQSVSKSFVRNIINVRGQSADERFLIIDDLDLMIPRGKITALIGGNGAGKTTLFNIISGFMHPDRGHIFYYNNGSKKELIGEEPHRITKMGVGRMFQDSHIFPEMTVLENMLIADADDFGEKPLRVIFQFNQMKKTEQTRIQKAEAVFQDVLGENNDLWAKRFSLAGSLSFGQQRLLGLARLFMGHYDLVLLDEPTAGVNPAIIEQIQHIIRRMVREQKMTVFLIEHNMKVVLELSEYCSFMSHGKITAFGYTSDVIGNDDVRKTYLGI